MPDSLPPSLPNNAASTATRKPLQVPVPCRCFSPHPCPESLNFLRTATSNVHIDLLSCRSKLDCEPRIGESERPILRRRRCEHAVYKSTVAGRFANPPISTNVRTLPRDRIASCPARDFFFTRTYAHQLTGCHDELCTHFARLQVDGLLLNISRTRSVKSSQPHYQSWLQSFNRSLGVPLVHPRWTHHNLEAL